MAKQTFTTGQVLTAAQMTSLQQTAMGGGSATTKTASYVLVAADAGTTVTMTSVSATTITVNTALFAAGDTVYIQNLGAGVSTITAGTATVSTSATLALAQYEGGQLYFNSTSAAIFIKGAGAAAAAAGANYTLLNSGGTALTGSQTVTVSGISGVDKIIVLLNGAGSASASSIIRLRFNTDTTSGNYYTFGFGISLPSTYSPANVASALGSFSAGGIDLAQMGNSAGSNVYGFARIEGCNSSGLKGIIFSGMSSSGSISSINNSAGGFYAGSSVISSVSVNSVTGNFDEGSIYVYTSA